MIHDLLASEPVLAVQPFASISSSDASFTSSFSTSSPSSPTSSSASASCRSASPSATSLEVLFSLFAHEDASLPRHDYVVEVQASSSGFTAEHRTRCVQWMLSISEMMQLQPATCATAVNYVDREASLRAVHPDRLQLLASVALAVASKVHETTCIPLTKFVALAGQTFNVDHMRQMERILLRDLDFSLRPVVAHSLAHYLLDALSVADAQVLELTELMCDLALCEYGLLTLRPSVVAGAAILSALEVLNGSPLDTDAWTNHLQSYFRINAYDLTIAKGHLRRLLDAVQMAGPKVERASSPTSFAAVRKF
jgi:hypothetical protein